MRAQALGVRKLNGGRPDPAESGGVAADERGSLHEIDHAQAG